jgi:hypothetical protein
MHSDISSAHFKTHSIALIVQWSNTIETLSLTTNRRIAFMGIAMEMCRWIVFECTTVKPAIAADGLAYVLLRGLSW